MYLFYKKGRRERYEACEKIKNSKQSPAKRVCFERGGATE
jgi:hypothetical protein